MSGLHLVGFLFFRLTSFSFMTSVRPQLIFWLAQCKCVGIFVFPLVSFLAPGLSSYSDTRKPLDDKFQFQTGYSPVPYI